jgi:hypothetical protein
MLKQPLATLVVLGVSLVLGALPAAAQSTAPRKTLTAFASEKELADLFRKWQDEYQRRMEEERRRREDARARMLGKSLGDLQTAPAPAAKAAPPALAQSLASGAAESVTNVQHAGVDEGGIVKVHGDHLVILRRGRLFTVNILDRELKPVSVIDAYGDGIDPRGAWYDEMVIAGDIIAVIGYSYARGGTEVGLFEISSSGRLRYKSTYHLRSNDYYSSRNYASRLIGSKLIFYSPLFINLWRGDPMASLPAMRRWHQDVTPGEFRRIAPATRIYRTDEELDPFQGVALHTVTVCDLATPELDCESTAVLGSPGRVFYVSANSVFVWTTAWRRTPQSATPASAVFRIPLDGSAPSALKTAGSPVDQFSFLEGEDGHLNVLVRSNGRGDGMWAAEVNSGDLALLRVPLASFSDGRENAPSEAYRALPKVNGHAVQNRYIGSYLLYGAGAGWRRPQATLNSEVYAIRYALDADAHKVPLAHGVDRIEALGADAVVVGTDGRDLHFTSVRLGERADAVDRYTRVNAAQGETRSHGFYYKPETEREGMVGLPIIGGGRSAAQHLRRESAALLYLRNQSLKLSELGTLHSRPEAAGGNDGCRVSCVDWYGNSRPLFLRNRVFALMGYEIVEGQLVNGRITEVKRITFAPRWNGYLRP